MSELTTRQKLIACEALIDIQSELMDEKEKRIRKMSQLLAAIVTANASNDDMSQPLEDARRWLEDETMDKNTITVEIREKTLRELQFALDENKKLRAENKRQSKELAEQSIKMLVFNDVVEERDKYRAAFEVTEKLLNERQRVLDTIPGCPLHGPCVPHALDWIKQSKKLHPLLATIQETATMAPGGYLIDGYLMGLVDIALGEDETC